LRGSFRRPQLISGIDKLTIDEFLRLYEWVADASPITSPSLARSGRILLDPRAVHF